MVGLCGVLGEREYGIDRMAADLRWTGEEVAASYAEEGVAVESVHHPRPEYKQPATTGIETGTDTLVWAWGDVWGFNGPEGYRPRQESDARTTAEFCARRYDDYGISFAVGLNGTFAAVIYDRNQRTVFVLTDRLGTHPVYYARPKPETFVFSTRVQSLPIHPAVESGFDVEYLYEYFALGRVGGVKTPFTDVEELPPSSITTFDLDTGTTEIERYWQPEYEPLDRPFSYFADRFVDRFEAALDDRIDPDLTYGLLLSGGSDARAILAGVDDAVDLHTYHATGWRSRETRVAERLAAAADREFRVLQRDRDHHRRMLEETPRIMNFQGRFNEAHIVGFDDQLHEEVDVLVSGLAGDTLFREHAFPPIELDISPLGVVPLPIARRTKSVDNHIDRFADELPEYLATPPRLREILERNIELGETVVDHGIPCRSLRELVFYDDFYPFSNKSDFFYHALEQVMPHWTPFLDSCLVDLALRVPVKTPRASKPSRYGDDRPRRFARSDSTRNYRCAVGPDLPGEVRSRAVEPVQVEVPR